MTLIIFDLTFRAKMDTFGSDTFILNAISTLEQSFDFRLKYNISSEVKLHNSLNRSNPGFVKSHIFILRYSYSPATNPENLWRSY